MKKVNFDRKLPTILETDEPPQQETKPKVKTELKTETTVPPSPNPLSKIKTKVKWPSFEERKPDVKTIPKKVVKNETISTSLVHLHRCLFIRTVGNEGGGH